MPSISVRVEVASGFKKCDVQPWPPGAASRLPYLVQQRAWLEHQRCGMSSCHLADRNAAWPLPTSCVSSIAAEKTGVRHLRQRYHTSRRGAPRAPSLPSPPLPLLSTPLPSTPPSSPASPAATCVEENDAFLCFFFPWAAKGPRLYSSHRHIAFTCLFTCPPWTYDVCYM